MSGTLMTVKGHNGQIDLLDDKIRIARKGVLGFMTQGFKGEKDIRLETITSIQYKRANLLVNGYIQFAFSGGSEAKGGLLEATKDENTVVFTSRQMAEFDKLKDAIEQQQAKLRRPAAAAPAAGSVDDLEKLAALRDKGIITDADFEAKKKQILGI